MSIYAAIVTVNGSADLPAELDLNSKGLVYGLNLPHHWEILTWLASELGVKPLNDFVFADPEDLDFLEGEAYEVHNERVSTQKEWYEPSEGYETVCAMLQFLRDADRNSINRFFPEDSIEWIEWDLRAYQLILGKAVEGNEPFRIVIC